MHRTHQDYVADVFKAAARQIAKHGLDVSMGRIAKAAGKTEAALSSEFHGREVLLNALYVRIHCDLCSSLRACVVPSEPLRERAHAIWNAYIDWGLAHPDWRAARHRLTVSDILTEETRRAEALHFPDPEVLEAASESQVFGEHPPEFGEAIFIALAEATIEFAARDPARADAYKLDGFNAHWRVFFT